MTFAVAAVWTWESGVLENENRNQGLLSTRPNNEPWDGPLSGFGFTFHKVETQFLQIFEKHSLTGFKHIQTTSNTKCLRSSQQCGNPDGERRASSWTSANKAVPGKEPCCPLMALTLKRDTSFVVSLFQMFLMGSFLRWRWRQNHFGNVPSSAVLVFEAVWFIFALFLIWMNLTKRMNRRTAERKVAFFSGFNTVHVERFITSHTVTPTHPSFSAASYCSSAHVEPMSNRIIRGWLVCAPVSVVRPMQLKMATQKYASCSAFLKEDKRRKSVVWRHDASLKHLWRWHRFCGMTWIFTHLSEGRRGVRVPLTENFHGANRRNLEYCRYGKAIKGTYF